MPSRQTLHTFSPMFNARGKLRVHYSLPQPQQGFEEFHSLQECEPQAGSTSRARGTARQGSELPLGIPELPQNMGREKGTALPLLPVPSFYPPAGAGQEGPGEPL